MLSFIVKSIRKHFTTQTKETSDVHNITFLLDPKREPKPLKLWQDPVVRARMSSQTPQDKEDFF